MTRNIDVIEPKLLTELLPEVLTALAHDIRDSGGRLLLVGGFVRDLLLATPVRQVASKDLDAEVFGVDADGLLRLVSRYGQVNVVGASFGVIKLMPDGTGGEIDISLPRRDSRRGPGHRDFTVVSDPFMTPAEAARRRDLTINAISLDPMTGEIIDPCGGRADLEEGVLRAVDPGQFGDDPLRVLRVMSFAGRFGFSIDAATLELCRRMDLRSLSRERIGEEWRKLLLRSERPSLGLQAARQLRVIEQLHPELDGLWEVPQEPEWHPEGSVWEHVLLATDAAARIMREDGLSGDEAQVLMYGALCHDLGKKTTTRKRERRGVVRWTSDNHETEGASVAKSLLAQLDVPGRIVAQVLPIIRYHLYHIHGKGPDGVVPDSAIRRLAQKLQPTSIRLWDLVCQADANGSGRPWSRETLTAQVYRRSQELAVDRAPAQALVTGKDLMAEGLASGPELGAELSVIYERQLEGEFITKEEALQWWHRHRR